MKNIALVLSSGGARGFAHIGAIEELEKNGYTITSIAGSSMGALVGGMYAAGQLAVFKKWVCSLDKKVVFELLDFTLSSNGVIKGERVFDALKKIIPDKNIESLLIPYCAVATDIINSEEVVFRKGSLYDGIKASSSIPTLVTPFTLNELLLVDGGVMNPVPINHIARTKHDLLVVVNVNAKLSDDNFKHEKEVIIDKKSNHENGNEIFNRYMKYFNSYHKRNNSSIQKNKHEHLGYLELTRKSLNLMIHQISALTIELYKPDITINISKDSFGIYDFHKSAEIIEMGASAARETLNKINITAK